jgi:hypothetical protein
VVLFPLESRRPRSAGQSANARKISEGTKWEP